MIRLILRDLFPGRSTVGALRQRVHELEREIVYLRDERDGAIAVLTLRESEIATLQKRALRPDPTPGEARMLEIVRANPGLTAPQLGRIAFELDAAQARVDYVKQYGNEPGPAHWAVGLPDRYQIDLKSKSLSGLACKSLVCREKSGNTYRYWVSE